MSTIDDVFSAACGFLFFIRQVMGYIQTLLWAFLSPRAEVAARLLAVESQLSMHKHKIQQRKEPKPKFTEAFRLLWVCISLAWDQWQDWAHLMRPATVLLLGASEMTDG